MGHATFLELRWCSPYPTPPAKSDQFLRPGNTFRHLYQYPHQQTHWGTQTVYYHHHLLRCQHSHTEFPLHSSSPLQSFFPHSLRPNIAVSPPQKHSSLLHHHHCRSKHNLFLPLSNYGVLLQLCPRHSAITGASSKFDELVAGEVEASPIPVVFASFLSTIFWGFSDSRSSRNLCALNSKPKWRKLISFRGKLPAISLMFETDVLIRETRD